MKFNFEFQAVVSLAMGIFFGMFSSGLIITALFILVFEIFVFGYSVCYPPMELISSRISLNLLFIIGWIISRSLYLRETGFEDFSDVGESCWYRYC